MSKDILAVFILFVLLVVSGIVTAFTLKKVLDGCVTSVIVQQDQFIQ